MTSLPIMRRAVSATILSLLLSIIASTVYGQTCVDGRFAHALFSSLNETKGLLYGQNKQPTTTDPDAEQTLYLDVFEPIGDTAESRPLLVFAFGGAFVTGSRDADDVVSVCRRFARLGYVTASIDYRTSPQIIFSPTDKNLNLAVLKATHDMRAAIRFFRKNAAEEGNTWKIDTSLIFAGGISAGGITALHTAYLDDLAELPANILGDTTGLGGIQGVSGNAGYSSAVSGVINLCGALGDTLWLNSGDVPVVSVHGTEDEVVPYGSAGITIFNGNTRVDGSASIDLRAESVGVPHALYSFEGAGHTPFSSGFSNDYLAYLDTTVSFTSAVLANWVCEAQTASTPVEPQPAPLSLIAFPNPFQDEVMIALNMDFFGQAKPVIRDLQGRVIHIEWEHVANGFRLKRGNIPAGLYLLQIQDDNGRVIGNVRLRVSS